MGKGGGSAAPTQQTVQNTTIPSYAQPYVEDMLGRTAALTDINQNPYQNYGGQRIAGFTPMQTQAMTNMAGMQIAPQLGQATGFAGQSGTGSLQTAGQMAGVGQAYQRMATDPAEMQKYMNPYIQQALNPQLQLLNQQQALQGQGIAAKAAGQGAFGGNRATLAQGLNAQNYALAQQQAVGQGYNEAFRQAQQAQQFGANLGLQGLQGALAGYGQANQAAATLGQLGQTQYGQQMGINQAQMQAGAMQQALQQQGLDVAYQDFLKERNYPYQQLAFQSDMLRGLPLSQSASTIYSAPPSMGSQLGGLGMTGLGIYGMSGGFRGAKSGGLMDAKAYKEGGQIGYKVGGDISMMTTKQLTQLLDNPRLSPMEEAMIEEQLMLRARMENNPQTAQIMGGGLDTVPSGDMFQAAGGGIVAFSGEDGSLVKKSTNPTDDYLAQYTDKKGNIDLNKAALSLLGQARPDTESKARQDLLDELKEQRENRPYEILTRLGVGTMAGDSQYPLKNLGLAGVDAMNAYAKDVAAERATKRELAKLDAEGAAKDDARRLQLAGTLLTIQGHKDMKAAALANAPSAEDRAINRAQALINNDPLIKKYINQQKLLSETDPQYQVLDQRIAERQNQIFQTANVKVPPITPSQIPDYVPPKEESFWSKINPFSSSAPTTPSQNKVIPFSQLPS